MTQQELAERLLAIIRVLSTNPAITDTLWLRDGVTVVDELSLLAWELGASENEVEVATAGTQGSLTSPHPTTSPHHSTTSPHHPIQSRSDPEKSERMK